MKTTSAWEIDKEDFIAEVEWGLMKIPVVPMMIITSQNYVHVRPTSFYWYPVALFRFFLCRCGRNKRNRPRRSLHTLYRQHHRVAVSTIVTTVMQWIFPTSREAACCLENRIPRCFLQEEISLFFLCFHNTRAWPNRFRSYGTIEQGFF